MSKKATEFQKKEMSNTELQLKSLEKLLGLSENRQHAQTAGLFRLLCTIFPCNTQSIPAEKWLQQAKNPSLLVIFPVFR